MRLTERQYALAEALATVNAPERHLARTLNCNFHSMRRMKRNVFLKLGVHKRTQLAYFWTCPLFQIGLDEFLPEK